MAEYFLSARSLRKLKDLLNNKKTRESYKVLRVLCGPMRFKIALVLHEYKKGLTVTELSNILDASLSRVSHQLRILREYRLVSAKRENREVVYMVTNHRIRKFFPF